jgi:hypothetical protein
MEKASTGSELILLYTGGIQGQAKPCPKRFLLLSPWFRKAGAFFANAPQINFCLLKGVPTQ